MYTGKMSVRVRFAPSPTGHLHVGNVRTALYNWLFARQHNGVFVLRIEDTDASRSGKIYEEQLLEDLRWLGLDWDEGVDVGGLYGPYRQSDRFDLYQQFARQLLESAKAYYCFCTAEQLEEARREQVAEGQQPRYSGRCRKLAPRESARRVQSGEAATVRLSVRSGKVSFEDRVYGPIEVDCGVIGDFVLLRSDGSPQYNFAVVVDDTLMGVTHVIRGEGHLSNTPRQLLLYESLGLQPPIFAHLSTVLGKDGAKLSKRHGAASIDEFKERGYLPEALVNYLALLGWAPPEKHSEILTPEELVAQFDLSRVNRNPAVFDLDKLNWVNRNHLKRREPTQLAQMILPYLQGKNWVGAEPSPEVQQWLRALSAALLKYLDKLEDVVPAAHLVFEFDPPRDLARPEVESVLSQQAARRVIEAFYEEIEGYQWLDSESYKAVLKRVKASTGEGGRDLFHPIRVALTARVSGPQLDKLVPILERGQRLDLPTRIVGCRDRVKAVLEWIKTC
ncbi:MAG: glutamate--tRNA ligase [Acidobacteriota bacterium]